MIYVIIYQLCNSIDTRHKFLSDAEDRNHHSVTIDGPNTKECQPP